MVSVLKVSLLFVIISIQAYLLHGKSLGPQSSGAERDISYSTKRTADSSSCTPDASQLEFYSQLYSGIAPVNSLNGNTMNYALRAIQIQAESANTAEDDDAIIASITDQSKFSPAGMDTANKVVCARVLQELNAVANSISNTALCGWDYICDYKADRFPNYLFKARCRTSRCNGNCNQENNNHNRCQSHGIHVTVLEMTGNCGEWVWGQELLPIACSCTSDILMSS